MANKRIKDLGTTASTLAADDYVAIDGNANGTRKIVKGDLVNDISTQVAGTYLDEANNLSDVASKDTSKLNLEVPDVGTAPNEVPLSGQLGSMAFQDSSGVSVEQLEADTLTVDSGGSTQPTQSVVTNAGAEGSALELRNSAISADTATALTFTNSTIAGANYGKAKIAAVRTNEANGNTDVVISTSASGSLSEAVRIDSSQRVGINTPSPDFALDVAGDMGIDEKIYHNGDNNTYLQFNSDQITVRTGGTDRLIVNNTAIQMGTGMGIDFGSGGASSVLDDYERGTATPTDASGAGLTLAGVGMNYVKIGSQVTAWVKVTYPTTSDTSTARIGNLPFAIGSSDIDRIGGFVASQDTGLSVSVLGTTGTGQVTFRKTSGAPYANSELSGKFIWFCFIYDVS